MYPCRYLNGISHHRIHSISKLKLFKAPRRLTTVSLTFEVPPRGADNVLALVYFLSHHSGVPVPSVMAPNEYEPSAASGSCKIYTCVPLSCLATYEARRGRARDRRYAWLEMTNVRQLEAEPQVAPCVHWISRVQTSIGDDTVRRIAYKPSNVSNDHKPCPRPSGLC